MPHKDPAKRKQYKKEYYANHKLYHAAYYKIWRVKNKDKCNAHSRKWSKNHPEYTRAKSEEKYNRHKDETWFKIRHCAYTVKWKRKNPEHARKIDCKRYQRDHDKRLAAVLKYAKDNPAKCNARAEHRRARQMNAPGYNYTTIQHVAWRWQMFGNKCYVCNTKATATDHVIPLSRGGAHFPANLRPICKRCNSRKHARPLNVFIAEIEAGVAI